MANVPVSNMTVTWTDSGTTYNAVKMNVTDTASNAASLLMDLQVGGTSKFKVPKNGNPVFVVPTSGYLEVNGNGDGFRAANGSSISAYGIYGVRMGASNTLSWGSSADGPATADTTLARDAADTLAQRRTTNAQTFRVYNTYTNSTDNYERGFLKWATNILAIGTEKGSVGGTARDLAFQTDGTTRMTISALGTITSAAGYVLQPASPLTWLTRGEIYFNADGVAMLRNNAGTDFGRLQFGGTTSSFPSLKRETNTLRVRLADDSGDAQLIAHRLTAAGGILENTSSFYTDNNGVRTSQTGYFAFSSSGLTGGAPDVYLYRDAAGTLAQRNTTNPQTFYVYNTTDGTNSERGFIKWNANVLEIGAEKVGTGTPRNVLIKSNSGVLTFNDGNSAMVLTSGDLQVGTRTLSGVTSIVQSNYHQMTEMTAPAAPAANNVRIYAEDNGSGKTRLMALFPTGVAQQIAIEP